MDESRYRRARAGASMYLGSATILLVVAVVAAPWQVTVGFFVVWSYCAAERFRYYRTDRRNRKQGG